MQKQIKSFIVPYLESRYDFKIPKQILIGFHNYAELFSPIILCLDNHIKKKFVLKSKKYLSGYD